MNFSPDKRTGITACEDPDDNKFIECAIAGDTNIIVSGDKHLLRISGYQGISVLKPREFADRYIVSIHDLAFPWMETIYISIARANKSLAGNSLDAMLGAYRDCRSGFAFVKCWSRSSMLFE